MTINSTQVSHNNNNKVTVQFSKEICKDLLQDIKNKIKDNDRNIKKYERIFNKFKYYEKLFDTMLNYATYVGVPLNIVFNIIFVYLLINQNILIIFNVIFFVIMISTIIVYGMLKYKNKKNKEFINLLIIDDLKQEKYIIFLQNILYYINWNNWNNI
jgi:hypothetical protein